jgi:hypothetical protein
MIAFWDIHDETLTGFDPAISTSQGLPVWVNHVAFHARDEDHLRACVDRWLAFGVDVAELDHGWCRSVYATDPNGILVEWCMDTLPLTDGDRAEAERVLHDPAPVCQPPPEPVFHVAADVAATRG